MNKSVKASPFYITRKVNIDGLVKQYGGHCRCFSSRRVHKYEYWETAMVKIEMSLQLKTTDLNVRNAKLG